MILGIYCYRDDVSQILSGFSLHSTSDVAIDFLGVSTINLLLDNADVNHKEDFDIFLKNLHERFSHLSILKVGEFNMLTGEVKNIDNLVIYTNENMNDLFNVMLNDFKNKKGVDSDV